MLSEVEHEKDLLSMHTSVLDKCIKGTLYRH